VNFVKFHLFKHFTGTEKNGVTVTKRTQEASRWHGIKRFQGEDVTVFTLIIVGYMSSRLIPITMYV